MVGSSGVCGEGQRGLHKIVKENTKTVVYATNAMSCQAGLLSVPGSGRCSRHARTQPPDATAAKTILHRREK